MFPTVEVRWFYRGKIPGEVWDWFQGAGEAVKAQPSRVDAYLRLPGNERLGIKVREGRLEIKQREEVYGVHRFQEMVEGVVEGWRKWGFPMGDRPVWLTEDEAVWIEVRKKRWMRVYTLEDEIVREIAWDSFPVIGCGWEVAEVGLVEMEEEWWSLGFEAFGDEEKLKDTLLAVVGHVLGLGKPPAFEADDSYGYPGWMGLWSLDSDQRTVFPK